MAYADEGKAIYNLRLLRMMWPFLHYFVIISFEWFEMIVWTQSDLIFAQSSDDFIFISYCIMKRIANCIGSTPNQWEGWGAMKKKRWRTTGRQSHGFDFCLWIRFLIFWANSFGNFSWLIQDDDTNKKLFQDCAAKMKTQIAWLKTSKCHPWFHMPSTSMSLWERLWNSKGKVVI